MGRRSSDSEGDSRSRRKKRHHRRSSSSSSSDSRTSSRKKSSRRSRSKSRSWSRDHHTRSRSRDRRRRRRSSSDSSYESRKRRSSRSRSRDRARSYRSRHSRSRSRTKRHRPRSRSRSGERSSRRRSHSWSRERERRKGRDKERAREKEREKSKKELHISKHGDSGNIKSGLEHLVSSSQAKTKLQIALQAAAKLDTQKTKERTEEVAVKKEEEQYSLAEQVKRLWDIEAIESDKFIQQEFKSSRDTKKSADTPEGKRDHTLLSSGSTGALATDIKQEISEFPVSVKYLDDDSLAHPSLFIDKAVAEEQWFKRLISLRQERLMGSPVC